MNDARSRLVKHAILRILAACRAPVLIIFVKELTCAALELASFSSKR
ncbi:MAG: hypothetical protein AAF431_03595 [Pseudomonadota bacterium]